MSAPTDILALIGVGFTALGLIAQAALFAFFLGKLSARVEGLEARAQAAGEGGASLAAITATLSALKDSVDDIRTTFARRFEAVEESVKTLMLMGSPGPRRSARAEPL